MSNIQRCPKCDMGHEPTETCENAKARFDMLMEGIKISKSGYGGVLPTGQIVDRREFPKAMPISENSMFGIPKPIKL